MNNNQTIQKTQRIEYIDSLRGFTMILVVLNHVAAYSLGIKTGEGSLHFYLMQFRMPLFFFISGFVLYKRDFIWSITNSISFINKKLFVQIISPFIFYLIYIYITDKSFTETISHPLKGGFWFTYTLFEYFIIYILCQRITMLFKVKNKYYDILLLTLGVTMYLLTGSFIYELLNIDENISGILGIRKWKYFLFFICGTLVKRNFATFQAWLDNNKFIPLCVIVYFLTNIFAEFTKFPGVNIATTVLQSLSGIAIVFAFFRKHQDIFNKESKVGGALQFIGKRTLDIYLLHIFLLPRNIIEYFPNITILNNIPLIEFFASLVITAMVIIACLGFSAVLRLNPMMAHYLFGQKKQTR